MEGSEGVRLTNRRPHGGEGKLTPRAQADTCSVTASISDGTDKVSKMTREHW